MRQTIFILLLFVSSCLFASNDSTRIFQGYSGGMLVHCGYLFGHNAEAPLLTTGVPITPQGATFGIGGSLRVHLMRHLRVGFEGFVSTMNSSMTDMRHDLHSGSYVRTGWGGLIADACWRLEKVWPYVGASAGGGAMHSLFVIQGNQMDWEAEEEVILHKQGFLYIAPYIGCDWCMTPRVHITLRMDWTLAMHDSRLLLPTGPRFYIGFMFCH